VSAPLLTVGQIILAEPSMQMLEVIVAADLLDIALAHKLDMEGGRTGRHVQFRPSSVTRVSSL
jgi:hypothetical protein